MRAHGDTPGYAWATLALIEHHHRLWRV